MRGATIGKVIATKSSKVVVGDYVTGTTGWTELAVMAEKDVEKVEIPPNGKLTDLLGVLGASLPGCPAIIVLLAIRLQAHCRMPSYGRAILQKGAAIWKVLLCHLLSD